MKNTRTEIPIFKNSEEEEAFWMVNDSTDFLDWTQAKTVEFPNLKPSLKSISLRLPQPLLDRLKVQANQRDIPYQSLIKMILAEYLEKSLSHKTDFPNTRR